MAPLGKKYIVKVDFSPEASRSLQAEVCRKLVDDTAKAYGSNCVSIPIIRERYNPITCRVPGIFDSTIATAMVTSKAMVQSSNMVIHCRFKGLLYFNANETTKFHHEELKVQLSPGRAVVVTCMVKGSATLRKADLMVTLEMGLLPAETIHELILDVVNRLGLVGYLYDARVIYHFSRGDFFGQKITFNSFEQIDNLNADAEELPFKDYLINIFQEIGWTLINADPKTIPKTKVHHYSMVQRSADPELYDWDTCPCFSASCSGAPMFFKVQNVCSNF